MKTDIPNIIIELNSTCNLNCRYCYNIWKIKNSRITPFNSYGAAKKTLKRVFKLSNAKSVTLTGGEPFLSERLFEIVLFCRMQGKNVTLITNGCAAKEGDYKQMTDMGVTLFELPFHSINPQEHDYMTRVDGSWESVNRSLKTLQKLNANIVPVIVLTKANYLSIEKTLMYLSENGMKRIMLNRFNLGGEGIYQRANLQLPVEQLQNTFSIANAYARTSGITLSSNVCTPRCILDPADYPRISFSFCYPDTSHKPLTVDIHGNLRMCNHSPVQMGNIFKQSFEEIFATPYAQSWHTTIPDFCMDCTLYNKCFGGCRAASEQLGRTLAAVDPLLDLQRFRK